MDIKRLNREQLLELLLSQQQTIESQALQIQALQSQLDEKVIKLERAGSIAEASLAINEVFKVAQRAADQYLLSIKAMHREE